MEAAAIVAIVAKCRAIGCRLTPTGDRLALAGTKPPPDLLEAIRANKAAILAHLAATAPAEPATPAPPRQAEPEPGNLPAAPPPLSAADRESVAFAAAGFETSGRDLPPDAAPRVKCNQCYHADNDGQGDPVAGWLRCRLAGFHPGWRGGWGCVLRECPCFIQKAPEPAALDAENLTAPNEGGIQ